MTEVVWKAERVSFRHPGAARDAVSEVSCDLTGGGVTAILGPNGAGKSTFVRLLIGLLAPTRGIVQFRGRSLGSWARGAIAREVGFVPQGEESVFPMTVRELVAMGRYPHLGPWRAESDEDRRLVRHALEDVDAFPFAERPFSTLSGGEQQRVRIARALAQHGSAIVLDEPTAGLDVRHEIELFALLHGLASQGRTVVLVTHNLSLASRLADRVLLFSEGALVAQGDPRTVLTGETLTRVYGWPIDVVEHAGANGAESGPLVVPRLTPRGIGLVIRRILALMACICVLHAAPLRAQHAPELRGRVVDAATSTPLQDAEVLSSDGARAVTGTDGTFVLRALKPGPAQVTVRRVGYSPAVRDVDLVNGSASTLTVMLSAAPVQLAELSATSAPVASGGVTSIDRAAIEQSGASDLGDILQQQGGVVVTRAGGPGSPATASIRGSSANQVLVLVDGVPQNQAVSGSADLSLVRLDNVEKISVVRGAQSARYGQQALGGAIVVETRRPVGVEAQADVGAGSYGGRALAGRVGLGRGSAGGLAASLAAAYNDFAGDFAYDIPPERGGGTGVRLNSAARDVSVNGSAAWTGTTAEARLRGEYFDVDRGMPGTVVQPSLSGHQTQLRYGAGIDGSMTFGRTVATANVALQRQDATFADSAPPFTAPYDDANRADVFLADVGVSRPAGRWELSAGAQFQRMGISGTALSVDAPGRTLYGGVRVAARAPIVAGSWALDANAALRVDGSSVTDQWYVSPAIGALLRHDWWSAELRWAQGYNPPTLGDMYFQEGVQVQPNPLLAPERVRSEFSLFLEARQVGPASLNASLGLNVFVADINGMILWSPDFRYIWSPNNFDVNRRGGELNLHLAPQGSHLAIAGGVALASVTYDNPVITGQVIYRPLWSATASADASVLGFEGGLAYRYAGSRRTAPGTDLNSLAPVHLLDFRVSRTIPVGGMAVRARFAIDNVIGTRTGMLVDFPLPGRLLRFDISLRYGS